MTPPAKVRYTVIDDRTRRCQGIGKKDREPWKVVDNVTNRYVDEYASARAARAHAKQLNAAELLPHSSDCPHWVGEPCKCNVGQLAGRGE